jgi:hypothetical protein
MNSEIKVDRPYRRYITVLLRCLRLDGGVGLRPQPMPAEFSRSTGNVTLRAMRGSGVERKNY